MNILFNLKWNIINPIFKRYCRKGCGKKPKYRVSFNMPYYNSPRITQLLCPDCAKVFLNWSEEERVRRENDDKLYPWAYENVVVNELHSK